MPRHPQPSPSQKKNGLSFLWLNSIPATWTCIGRDSSVRERHSSRFSCCCRRHRLSYSRVCVCVCARACVQVSVHVAAAQICLGDARKRWWERNVISKAIEHLACIKRRVIMIFFFPPSLPLSSTPPHQHLVSLRGAAVAVFCLWFLLTSLSVSIDSFRVRPQWTVKWIRGLR